MDNKKRSLTKAISWRLIATGATMLIVWAGSGSLKLSLAVGAFDVIIKLVLYFAHERVWGKIGWGTDE